MERDLELTKSFKKLKLQTDFLIVSLWKTESRM